MAGAKGPKCKKCGKRCINPQTISLIRPVSNGQNLQAELCRQRWQEYRNWQFTGGK